MAEVRESAGVDFGPMGSEHVPEVAAIEAEAFTTPWSTETFESLLGRDGVETRVALSSDGSVVGYAIVWCILEQGELANIAIHPSRRGEGLGRRLLSHVIEVAKGREVERLYLEVRASNRAALALYEAFGFSRVGLRKGYYDRPKEDALVMLAHL